MNEIGGNKGSFNTWGCCGVSGSEFFRCASLFRPIAYKKIKTGD